MDLDPELLKVLIDTFIIELDEQSQLMTDGLLRIESSDDGNTGATVDAIFRAAHNIKGAARGVNMRTIGDIAHIMEDLFTRFKESRLQPPSYIIDICFKAIDHMGNTAKASASGKPVDEQGILEFIEELKVLVKEYTDSISASEQSKEEGNESQQNNGKKKSKSIKAPIKHDQSIDNNKFDRRAQVKKRSGKKKSEQNNRLIDSEQSGFSPSKKGALSGGESQWASDVISVTMERINLVNSLSEELQASKIALENYLESFRAFRSQMDGFMGIWNQAQSVWFRLDKSELPVELQHLFHEGHDSLSSLSTISSKVYTQLRANKNQVSTVSNALQDAIRHMRLVPSGTILNPLKRDVRDISRELGKKVSLMIKGEAIELDRVVLEGVRAPLLHIIRNAIDHGIEAPEIRKERGKKATGSLAVIVQSQGGHIRIIVKDDGNGICPEAVANIALNKQLVSEQELEAMDASDKLNLIFTPGFSSKEAVTDISGRGVGLDVVSERVRALKGQVRIETEAQKGTQFILKLPVTLVTDHGLLVAVGHHQFAIPTTHILRVLEVERDQIIHVEGGCAVLYEEKPVPIRELSSVLGLDETEMTDSSSFSMILIARGKDSVAFLVDEIIGERELIIKPFLPPLESVPNINGGAFMGNGDLVMVLNPDDMVNTALGLKSRIRLGDNLENDNNEENKQHLLVVDDSITTRILEQSILENAGYQVTAAVDGRQAWELIQKTRFDLIVTDIEMPYMDGFELTAKIKRTASSKDIPTILVSSLANPEHKQKGLEVGADAYIIKGRFETRALLDAVKRLLNHRLKKE